MSLQLPQPFSALIFDCDGTLVDTAPAHFRAVCRALDPQGHAMPRDWYMARAGLTPDALLDALEAEAEALGNPGTPLDRPAIFARYNVLFGESLEHLREVEAIAGLARAWRGRVPMAVASNGRRGNVEASLRATGLFDLFDTLVAAEDVERGKPAPDVFLEAARRMHVEPGDCVVLEDSDEGLTAARAAGMRAVDVRRATVGAAELRGRGSAEPG